jgi:iron complex outermembrane receptor protein
MFMKKTLAALVAAAFAQGVAAAEINIEAQDLPGAIRKLGAQTGIQVIFTADELSGLKAAAVHGNMPVEAALRKLLAGCGCELSSTGANTFVIRREGKGIKKQDALDEVVVSASRLAGAFQGVQVKGETLAVRRSASSDTARLLDGEAGVSLYGSGAVSSLPALHGLEDERVKVLVDGMSITSACSNHMNPPLSYIDATRVASVRVMAGVTPVSWGGDSIAGTISVESSPPVFAGPGETVHKEGSLSAYYRGNTSGAGGSLSAAIASDSLSIGFSGALDRAGNLRDGNGKEVPGTRYKTQNQSVTFAARGEGRLFVMQAGTQRIPYQGFVNATMDMTRNDATYLNARYDDRYSWGNLSARAFYQETRHEMDNFPERNAGHMLMLAKGKDSGYEIKAEIPLSVRDTLRVGNDFHRQKLNDWWPGTTPWYAMPQDAVIIKDGIRDRFGLFAEWDAKWSQQWGTLLGLRSDTVKMDAGQVQGYWGALFPAEMATVNAFNALPHGRKDHNLDISAQASYQPNESSLYEFGIARKTRSPSLYERYFWYGPTNMAGWFGDNNNYNGNINLRPETAYNLSVAADWHDPAGKEWQFRVAPFYSRVHDYIDVNSAGVNIAGLAQLTFANSNAELYGLDISGKAGVWESTSYGRGTFSGYLGWVHGKRLNTGGSLYHMMPLNARLSLEQSLNAWTNAVELQLVDRKNRIDALRQEPTTPGYALVNVRTAYQWQNLRLDLGITNLLDKAYYPPLGGVNIYKFWADAAFPFFPPFTPVPGQGRSVNAGVTMSF